MPTPTPPVFQLPAALLSQGFRLRPEAEDDIPFLCQLYASTREDELAPVPWTAEQKQAFLTSQFFAQRHHYRSTIPGCVFDVLEHNGVATGRLYLNLTPTRLHIVDIALTPEWRGKGLGSALLAALQATAKARGRGLGIFVEKFNPALRLYQRLGFTAIADREVYLEMEWLPQDVQLNIA